MTEEELAAELAELRAKYHEAERLLHQRERVIARMEDIVAAVIRPRPLVADAVTCTSTDFLVPRVARAGDASCIVHREGLNRDDPLRAGVGEGRDVDGFVSPQLQVSRLQRLLELEREAYVRERGEYEHAVGRLIEEAAGLGRAADGLARGTFRQQ